eukprot:Clim_evm10s224 gene=Clim_evmTU10s224
MAADHGQQHDGSPAQPTHSAPQGPELWDSTWAVRTLAIWPWITCLGLFVAYYLGTHDVSIAWILIFFTGLYLFFTRSQKSMMKRLVYAVERQNARRKIVTGDQETAEWLNEIVNRYWWFYEEGLSNQLKQTLEQELEKTKPGMIKQFFFSSFALNDQSPQIRHVRFMNIDNRGSLFSRNTIPLKLTLELWSPDMDIVLVMKSWIPYVSIKFTVSDFFFRGKCKVVARLVETFPHVETVSISFTEPPEIDFSLRPVTQMMNLMDAPLLAGWIRNAVMGAVVSNCVDPEAVMLRLIDDEAQRLGRDSTGVLVLSVKEVRLDTNVVRLNSKDIHVMVGMGATGMAETRNAQEKGVGSADARVEDDRMANRDQSKRMREDLVLKHSMKGSKIIDTGTGDYKDKYRIRTDMTFLMRVTKQNLNESLRLTIRGNNGYASGLQIPLREILDSHRDERQQTEEEDDTYQFKEPEQFEDEFLRALPLGRSSNEQDKVPDAVVLNVAYVSVDYLRRMQEEEHEKFEKAHPTSETAHDHVCDDHDSETKPVSAKKTETQVESPASSQPKVPKRSFCTGRTGLLRVTLHYVDNLPPMDLNGLTDCYIHCIRRPGNVLVHATRCIRSTLEPRFEETFEMMVDDVERTTLRLNFYDQDDYTADDYIGKLDLALKNVLGGANAHAQVRDFVSYEVSRTRNEEDDTEIDTADNFRQPHRPIATLSLRWDPVPVKLDPKKLVTH